MFRKNYFTTLLAAALLLIGSIAAIAQVQPVRGKVELKKADGTTVPVADATIDILRTDVKSTTVTIKTNQQGEFSFEGFPPEAVFVLSVSAPKINPEYYPNLKAGLAGGFGIIVTPGNGRRLTESEIRQVLASAPAQNVKLTEEQRKKQEELDKQIAEINAKNAKSKESDAVVKRVLDEGSKAFDAKNYDLAIAKFDEGYKASPDYVGSAPVLLSNKGLALRLRGATAYNQGRELTDPTAKIENTNKVTKDFAEAVDSYNLSWTILKNAPAAQVTDVKNHEANKMQALRGAKDLVKVIVITERIDPSKTAVIRELIQEYITVETDKAAKTEAQIVLADAYRIAADSDKAIVEYRKALEMSPDNPDALAGLGLSLFNSGETTGNTQQKQEGLNFMQRFAEVAPETHKLKKSVADVVEYLKSQKLTPQKTTKKKN